MTSSMNQIDAKKRLLSIKRLPASPQIVQEVLNLWKDPETPMAEYEEAIAKDPALVTEVLKVVNSPFYGMKNRVANLKIALSMLGLRETYRIVANRGFYKVFRTVFSGVKFNMGLFWQHCQAMANTAYWLAEKHLPGKSSEAYVAGLLLDIGRLAMAQFFPEEWEELEKEHLWQPNEGLEGEEKVFGLTHSELGATLLIRWSLPREIVLPVRYHHDPLATPAEEQLVAIAYFAEKIATYFLTREEQKEIYEYFIENDVYQEMCGKYPDMNMLGDREKVEEIRPVVLRQM